MWQTGTILRNEPFSFTAFGTSLHNHWWLAQLAFFALFQAGGPRLLTAVAGGCAFLAVLGSYRLCRGPFEIRIFLLAFLVSATSPEWAVRPQVISLALFVLAVHLADRNRLEWLPALCVLWANLHAQVVFGIGIACAAAVEALLWSRDRVRQDLTVVALCLAAPALTPTGWHYWPQVLRTVAVSKGLGLQEYRVPLWLSDAPFWIAVGLLAALTVRRRRDLAVATRSDRILLIAAIGSGLAAVGAARNVAFFAVVAAPVLARLLNPSSDLEYRGGRRVPRLVVAVSLVATVLIGSVFVAVRWQDGGARLGWRPISSGAVAAVRDCPDPIFNRLADGGYVMWALPNRRVFIDSRMEAYPLALLQQSRMADLRGEYNALFQRYGIRCALVATPSEMARRLSQDPGMRRTYADRDYMVFVR